MAVDLRRNLSRGRLQGVKCSICLMAVIQHLVLLLGRDKRRQMWGQHLTAGDWYWQQNENFGIKLAIFTHLNAASN